MIVIKEKLVDTQADRAVGSILLQRATPRPIRERRPGRPRVVPTSFNEALRQRESFCVRAVNNHYHGNLALDVLGFEPGAPMPSWFHYFTPGVSSGANLTRAKWDVLAQLGRAVKEGATSNEIRCLARLISMLKPSAKEAVRLIHIWRKERRL